MEREINALTSNYCSLLSKVNIVVGAITKVVECYHSLVPEIETKADVDVACFGKLDVMLGELKYLISKSSFSYMLTPGVRSFNCWKQQFNQYWPPFRSYSTFYQQAPLLLSRGCKGEKEKVLVKAGASGKASGKCNEDATVVGKVLTTQIPTLIPKKIKPIMATTTTRPIVKGIVIGSSNTGGSSSSSKPSIEVDKGKGKGVST